MDLVKSLAKITYRFDLQFCNSPGSAFLNMGGFYLHAFKITAGLGYLVFKLNQQCQQASELIRLQMCKFLGSVVQQVSFKMQIKFCDDICGVCQGPILGPILFNTSINGTEHTLSKLAGNIMLSSAVGITEGRDGSEGQ